MEILDLHGRSLAEARDKIRKSLDWCLNNGVDILDINHGKGHHSDRNFPVLKTEVRKLLKSLPEIKDSGYKVVYGETDLPVCLTFDAGHTLVLQRGLEKCYIGDQRQQEKNKQIFSTRARQARKASKANQALKRKGKR